MSDATSSQRRIAMLIDGDNAQPKLMDKMIAETSKYGVVNIRRIYGDWTESTMNSWKQTLHTYAVQPIQQFRYTVGKNATDSALIIDAMDILYTSGVDGFCLVSSDSDYTKLAMRIREKNLFVMGIGRRTTPRAFVNACDTFVYTENLLDAPRPAMIQSPFGGAPVLTVRTKKPASPIGAQKPLLPEKKPALLPPPPEAIEPSVDAVTDSLADALFPDFDPDTQNVQPNLTTLMMRAFDMAVGDTGWANLGAFGSRLRQLDPGFDPRTYGYRQLALLVAAHPDLFEVQREKAKDGSFGAVAIRLNNRSGKTHPAQQTAQPVQAEPVQPEVQPEAPQPEPVRPAPRSEKRGNRKESSRRPMPSPFRAAEVFGTIDLQPFRFDDLDEDGHVPAGDLLAPPDDHDVTVNEPVVEAQPAEPAPPAPPKRGRRAKAAAPASVEVAVAPIVETAASVEAPAPPKRRRKAKAAVVEQPIEETPAPPAPVPEAAAPKPRRRRKATEGG
jgi:uncharacterized LabA/DUF88 family protein